MSHLLRRLGCLGIASKIMSMSGTALVGMALLFTVAYTGFSNQKNSIDDLYNLRLTNFKESAFFSAESAKIHSNLYKLLAWTNDGFDEKQIKALAGEQVKKLTELEKRALELVATGKLNETELKTIKHAASLLKDYAKSAAEVIDVASDTAYASILMGTADDKFIVLGKALNELSALENALGKEGYDFANQSYSNGLRNFVVVSLLVLFVSVLLTIFVTRNLLKHIKSAQATVAVIASGDLTQGVRSDGEDEIGIMLRSVESMRTGLSSMIAEVRRAATELQERSETLLKAASCSGESSETLSASTMATAAAIEQFHTGLSVLDDNASEVQRFAKEAGERSKNGGSIISQVAAEMSQISQQVGESSCVVGALAKDAGNIGNIIDVIKGLADQTNLLALNAAIEAARAGESGRGFAVVADEVRKLAEDTRLSTERISEVVKGIQAHSVNASTSMDRVSRQVAQGMKLANEAQTAIEAIAQSATDLTQRMDAIALSLREQNATATEIARNVEGVADVSETTSNEAGKVTKEAMGIKSLSAELNSIVERFHL